MQYCPLCQVKVAGSKRCCPLCRGFARLTQDGVSLEVRSNTMYGEGS